MMHAANQAVISDHVPGCSQDGNRERRYFNPVSRVSSTSKKRRLPEIPLIIGAETADASTSFSPMPARCNLSLESEVRRMCILANQTDNGEDNGADISVEIDISNVVNGEFLNNKCSTVAANHPIVAKKQVTAKSEINEESQNKSSQIPITHANSVLDEPTNDQAKPSENGVDRSPLRGGDSDLLSASELTFVTTSDQNMKAFLCSNNPYLMEDSSPEDTPSRNAEPEITLEASAIKSMFTEDEVLLSGLEATHRGVHKFIPRHQDEVALQIGDPIYVEEEADDLWCKGVNLRTGHRGIFPSVYATDLEILAEEIGPQDLKEMFELYFLGSVEVNYHKGTDILCQAIHKVVLTRRMTLNTSPPSPAFLEVTDHGIKMTTNTSHNKKPSLKKKLGKLFSKKSVAQRDKQHFFSLKNVSFCGYHPKDERYFAFITKHPLEIRFASHVFVGEESTKPVGHAIGQAFKRFYNEYMAFAHPTEDIYLE